MANKKIKPATAMATRSREKHTVATQDEIEVHLQPDLPLYKPEISVFDVPVEEGKDSISNIPSEVLDQVLSYCTVDHDPERAAKIHAERHKYEERSHVLLSLASMSRHFRDHVEDFSRRHLVKHKETYGFKTNAELQQGKVTRRSPRLLTKPTQDHRCYRFELVRGIQRRCIKCGIVEFRRANMANGVACCNRCDEVAFPGQINLSDALHDYDLRDWMLIKTRKPGPRAKFKQDDLPSITYGTVRTGTPLLIGQVISYRFFRKEVEAVANFVHGNVQEHMETKKQQRKDRRAKKRRDHQRERQINWHEYCVEDASSKEEKEFHEMRLEHYRDPNGDPAYDSEDSEFGFDDYADPYDEYNHWCEDPYHCGTCAEAKMMKYHPHWY